MEPPASVEATATPEEVLYRLSLVKSFVDEVVKDISKANDETKVLSATVAAQLEKAIVRLKEKEEVPEPPISTATSVALSADAIPALRTLSDEANVLRKQAPTNALLLQYCALLELCPYLYPNGTISIEAEKWRLLSNRLPVFAVVSSLIRSGKLSFPYKHFDFGSTPAALFEYLKALDLKDRVKKSSEKYVVPNHHPSRLFPFTFDKSYTQIVAKDEDYEDADKLVLVRCFVQQQVDYFQEECRMRAKRADQLYSPLEYWRMQEHHSDLVHKAVRHGGLTSKALREAVWESAKECTQFKPTLVVCVVRLLNAHRMLDFSAGWGDRLAGAIAAGVDKYVACDPNAALRSGHEAIKEAFCPDPERRKNFEVIYEPFEKATLPAGVTFDLIFTSPPFFNFEIYSSAPGQSVISFPQLTDWLVRFLFFSLRKSWSVLEVGGNMVIHIADVYRTKVCEPMNLYCQAYLRGARYRGLLGCSGGEGRARPMWVWRKEEHTDNNAADEAHRHLHREYPDVFDQVDARGDTENYTPPAVGKKRTR